jgi:hypothetical protein
MKKHNYNVRWGTIANVSFQAISDYHARKQADKIARELNVTKTPRTITKDGKLI